MKAVMVMFDSLNRRYLSPYAGEQHAWVRTPNFARLARHAATFDQSYVCSMPCMPARRDLHTGRPNFLHRAWGPLEPFDDSMPQMLREAGVHTHLSTDHYHYWEDGGATYHNRYRTYEFHRGQEGDLWKGQVARPDIPPLATTDRRGTNWEQDWVNRLFMAREHEQSQAGTFAAGIDFIERNRGQDRWFLTIETFDPHEPFFSHRKFKDLYPEHYAGYRGEHFDWPPYRGVRESREVVEHLRFEYAALLSMCDAYLGEVLDTFDRHGLWDDTMLIVWTDHGFLLGEHDAYAKVWLPFYNEVAHTPFFVWDPRCGVRGERRSALVQPSIDLPVTLLNYFGLEPTADMLGRDLSEAIARDAPVRDAAMFGVFGGQVNVTDGRYVYMRAPTDSTAPLYEYTLMPTVMRGRYTPEDMRRLVDLAEPFGFMKGCRTMRFDASAKPSGMRAHPLCQQTMLFDLQTDPGQERPLRDDRAETAMIRHLRRLMEACEAPREQYQRLGLETA